MDITLNFLSLLLKHSTSNKICNNSNQNNLKVDGDYIRSFNQKFYTGKELHILMAAI